MRIESQKITFVRAAKTYIKTSFLIAYPKIDRMKKPFVALTLCYALFFSTTSLAQFRKYSNEFLNIGAGARGLAMGSSQVASVQDGTAGYWNPAGLADVKDVPNVNVMHAEYFSQIGKFDYASIALPLSGNKRTLGITALRFAVDDIPNTLFLVEPDGSINYNNITAFSSADYASHYIGWMVARRFVPGAGYAL